MSDGPSDAEPVATLLRQASAGDAAAWAELVRRYAGLVWSVARAFRLDRADAADVSQTTWLRLAEHVGAIRDADRLPGWLATTTRRESLRLLAARGREIPTDLTDDPGPDGPESLVNSHSPEHHVLVDDRNAALWRGLAMLPTRCQQLLRLVASAPELAYRDIAAALDLPIGGIGPTRARCLQRLKIVLSALGVESA